MSRAVEIALEYLEEGTDAQKKNALTALRALSTPEAIDELIERSLSSESEELRLASRIELCKVQPERRRRVVHTLESLIEGVDPRGGEKEVENWRRVSAYGLLAHLKGRYGLEVAMKNASPKTRLAFSRGLHRAFYQTRPARFYKGLLPGFLGGLTGAILLCAYLYLVLKVEPMSPTGLALVVWSLLAVWLFCFLPAGMATPIGAYIKREDGMVVEATRALGWQLPFALVALVIWLISLAEESSWGEDHNLLLVTLVAFFFLLAAPLVRLGTAMGHGLWPGRLGLALQTAAGVGASLIFFSAAGRGGMWLGREFELEISGEWLEHYSALWALAIPTSVGLALSYALVDREAPELEADRERQAAVRWPAWALLVATGLLVGEPLFGTWTRDLERPDFAAAAAGVSCREQWEELPAESGPQRIRRCFALHNAGARVNLDLGSGAFDVEAWLPAIDEEPFQRDLLLEVRRPGALQSTKEDDPPQITLEDKGGSFILRSYLYSDSPASLLPALAAPVDLTLIVTRHEEEAAAPS